MGRQATPGPKRLPADEDEPTERRFRVLTDRRVGGVEKGGVAVLLINDGAAQVLLDAGLVGPVEEKAAPLAVKLNKEARNG